MVILICNTISQYYYFYCIFDYAALVFIGFFTIVLPLHLHQHDSPEKMYHLTTRILNVNRRWQDQLQTLES